MIDDRTLTLYYFDDGLDERQRDEVKKALANDDLLAARFAALKQDLDALHPDPVESAPEHLKHQWHDLVKREAALERQRVASPPRRPRWLFLGGAMTAVLALGIAVGLFLAERAPKPPVDLANAPGMEIETMTPDALARGLLVTLESHQAELVGFSERPEDERAALALRIVMQNRIFERAAEQQESPEIARLLRAFEPILLRLAAEDTTPEDADALRRQLTFEFEAMLTKLQQPTSKAAKT